MDKFKNLLVSLLILGFIALIIGSFSYRFRGEEPRRTIISYEMEYFKNFSQPTFMGENYYRKPPFFNWLIILSSKISGWGVHTGRIVTIFFTVLTVLLIIAFSKKYIFDTLNPSLIAGLTFLSFIDVLFWYGFLAEIDMTFTFLIFLMIVLLIYAFKNQSFKLFSATGIIVGISFLTKGFPAFVFFFITFISLGIYYYFFVSKKIWKLAVGFIVSFIISIIPITLWVLNLEHPIIYIKTLWEESFNRVKESKNIIHLIVHIIIFPLMNIKQTLPASLIVIAALFYHRNTIKNLPGRVLLLGLIFIMNYFPYLISASVGRYILPILPLAAIIFAYIINKVNFYKIFIKLVLITIIIRVIAGIFYFPYENQKKGYFKSIAYDIFLKLPYNSKIASNCIEHKELIFYLDIFTNKVVFSERKLPDWEYFVSCDNVKSNALLLQKYKHRKGIVYLYKRNKK